jgi:membrane associated rhomboid family serine protease
MSTLWQEMRSKMLHSGSRLNLLIGINVAVFLLINIPAVIEFLVYHSAFIPAYANDYLALPASLHVLGTRFWTPITYMFMHASFFHILFNMLWLYWMGQLFEEYLGNKRIVPIYFFGGLAGAAFYIAAFNLFPGLTASAPESIVVGASASVMAIVVATATLLPNYTIYLMFIGPVKLKWLAIVFVLIDFLSIMGPNAGGEIAHIGGALMGFIYIKQLQRGNDWTAGISRIFTPKSKLKVVSRNSGFNRNSSATPPQDEIDRILDKISQSGIESLTRQERETLSRASKKD